MSDPAFEATLRLRYHSANKLTADQMLQEILDQMRQQYQVVEKKIEPVNEIRDAADHCSEIYNAIEKVYGSSPRFDIILHRFTILREAALEKLNECNCAGSEHTKYCLNRPKE